MVANDELLNKYLARNKKAVLGEIIATIQKEQNAIIRKSPKTNVIVQGVGRFGKDHRGHAPDFLYPVQL